MLLSVEVAVVLNVVASDQAILIFGCQGEVVMIMEEAGRYTKLAIRVVLLVIVSMDASTAASITTTVAKACIHLTSSSTLNCREKVLMDIEFGRKDFNERIV